MIKAEAKKRTEKLRKEINHYRYLYHVLDRQEISDAALDSLKKELFDIEQEFPDLVTPDSPTQRIGGKAAQGFKKVRHPVRMLSFNDAFTEEDIRSWIGRLENTLGKKFHHDFYCELKIDGIAIELIYEGGILQYGSTRGDGVTGEDITQNLKTIEAIPLSVPTNERVVVRGEVFLTKKEFRRINKNLEQEGKKPFANPRNIAAGSIRQLDPSITARRKLDSFQYDILDPHIKTHEEKHEQLTTLGFKTNPHNKRIRSAEDVYAFRNYWDTHREKLPYEVDGIVVMLNNNREFDDAGIIGKAPRGAIAYKFSPKEATTKVKNITVQVGRTGVLTPVAELEPVQVGGVTISHATLHNDDEIKRLGVRIRDTVIVQRAGDVIPQITSVLKNLRTGNEKQFHMPKTCPLDGSPIVQSGAFYRCSNQNCGGVARELLYHFVSRPAFDIRGLGPKIIDRLMDEGLLSDRSDIFTLQKGDIEVLERFGKKSAENLIDEIKEKKHIPFSRFLFSLGIHHVGEELSRVLSRFLVNKTDISRPKDLLAVIKEITKEGLQEIPDIGPASAQSIVTWFRNAQHKELFKKLDVAGIRFTHEYTGKGPLHGKTFVLTGTLNHYTRSEAKEFIRAKGGEIAEVVTKKVNYVVAGSDPGSKYEKAKKLNIPLLSEKEFLKLLNK